eukprot:214471_1
MHAVKFGEETTTSIILFAVSWTICLIITLTFSMILIHHFKTTISNVSLKIFPLLSTIIDVLICFSNVTISNNWLIPSLHNSIKFIDDHCFLIEMTRGSMFIISNSALWLFQLHRIKYFFISTNFKLSSFSYYMQLVTYTIITSIAVFHLVLSQQTVIASDHIKHKICLMVVPHDIEIHISALIFVFIHTFGVSIYLWYQLYSKTIKLELQYNDNEQLSPFFSQKDKQIMDTNNIKRGMFFSMLSTTIYIQLNTNEYDREKIEYQKT